MAERGGAVEEGAERAVQPPHDEVDLATLGRLEEVAPAPMAGQVVCAGPVHEVSDHPGLVPTGSLLAQLAQLRIARSTEFGPAKPTGPALARCGSAPCCWTSVIPLARSSSV